MLNKTVKKTKERAIPETMIQRAIINLFGVIENVAPGRFFFQRTNNVGVWDQKRNCHRQLPPGCRKGFPDLVCIIDGKFVGFEVKNETGKMSEYQIYMQERITRAGGSYHVVKSVEETKAILINDYKFKIY